MYTYYIATRPEAVVTLVQTGQLPNILPDWLEPKQIICSENIHARPSDSEATISRNLNFCSLSGSKNKNSIDALV